MPWRWSTAGVVNARYTLFDSEIDFLAFAPAYADLAEKLADAVTLRATPVGTAAVNVAVALGKTQPGT